MATSIQQAQIVKSKEPESAQLDKWTKLKTLLEPVCRNLKVGFQQVVEMIFTVLQSDRPDDSIQSDVSVPIQFV